MQNGNNNGNNNNNNLNDVKNNKKNHRFKSYFHYCRRIHIVSEPLWQTRAYSKKYCSSLTVNNTSQ